MGDVLNQLTWNPQFRKLVGTLGLPIPLPPKLRRASGGWSARPLEGRRVIAGFVKGGAVADAIAQMLGRAGATVYAPSGDSKSFEKAGVATAPIAPDNVPSEFGADALVYDASGVAGTDDLAKVYGFFHTFASRIGSCARVVVVGRPEGAAKNAEAAAASRALDGFVRAMSKEIGRRGSTANLVTVEPGAEDRLEGPLRYVLGDHGAYVTGQPIHVSKLAAKPVASPTFVQALDGKVALVTGAARGIGQATARALAAEGAHVIVLDRPDDLAASEETARSVNGTAMACDVTSADAPAQIADRLRAQFGGVDILVNNAGVTRDKTLRNMKREAWDLTVNVSLGAAIAITGALAKGPKPLLREGGRVVCLSSIAGIAGNFGQTNYSAAKAGVIGYVRFQASKLAPRGITINAVAPGFIETRMTAAIPTMTREIGRRIANLSQGGLPRDVADAITFLATPGAYGITGGVLRVCGGNMIGA
ncbi:MAG: 3-oxoacyl-ACP reductase [Deltaproteobacteria bacterium]|nr:3-oxoacyl-ACP reductase [Deltaproteobacteria bacterium]